MVEDARSRVILWPTDEQVQAQFDAYTRAVGKVAHAWNYLHEKLGSLFVRLVSAPDRNIVAAIWYSTYSDRVQRDMLLAAINASKDVSWASLPDHARPDLVWLISHAMNDLANHRDAAVHAPAIIQNDHEGARITTSLLSGHRRAKQLTGKQLLVEFDWCERYAEALSRFTVAAENALTYGGSPWPDKPRKPDKRRQIEVQPPRQERSSERRLFRPGSSPV